jgi:hypothetical protein
LAAQYRKLDTNRQGLPGSREARKRLGPVLALCDVVVLPKRVDETIELVPGYGNGDVEITLRDTAGKRCRAGVLDDQPGSERPEFLGKLRVTASATSATSATGRSSTPESSAVRGVRLALL